MSYNGSGTFNINTTGQPVVAGTVITATAFNLLTADLATGLTTAITKDGQTTTTARIPFAQGISSTLVTDSTNTTTGSIITDGGVGIAKNLNVGGTLNVTGATTLTNPVINNIKMGYTTTATAGGSTSLTVSSNYRQFFTGTLAQTIVLPVTSTLVTGMAYEIENNSTGTLTVNSSGGNLVGTIPPGVCAHAVCIGTTLTTAADWDWDYISTTTITGTGANVLGTAPTIASANLTTALTLTGASGTNGQVLTSGGSGNAPTWTTASASQWTTTGADIYYNSGSVGVGTTSPARKLEVSAGGSPAARFTGTNPVIELACAGGTNTNFMLAAQSNVGDAFEITPSTTAGGFTFSTPAAVFRSNGQVSIGTTGGGSLSAKLLAYNSTNAPGLEALVNATSALGNPAIGIGKLDNNNTTSNTFVQFNVNGFNSGSGQINANGASQAAFGAYSDRRLKENIVDLSSQLSNIMALRPVEFDYIQSEGGGHQIGFIAQEVKEIYPDLVGERTDGMHTLSDMNKNDARLIKGIQEMYALITSQAATITALTARITALENA